MLNVRNPLRNLALKRCEIKISAKFGLEAATRPSEPYKAAAHSRPAVSSQTKGHNLGPNPPPQHRIFTDERVKTSHSNQLQL